MAERELELRLRAVARTLDADAPTFDPALLRGAPRRRLRPAVVALVAAAVLGIAAAPGAVSGLKSLFGIDEVKELGPVPYGVTDPFEGRQIPPKDVLNAAPFPVSLVPSLGSPDAAFVRDDVTGGMITVVYGQTRLTQWRETDVDARITIVPAGGVAEDVKFGRLPALWIEGRARGTFTLIGADGTVHRERFEVSPGVLLWKADGMAFLLQGAPTKVEALQLAAQVDR
jgi:hypothetical protein